MSKDNTMNYRNEEGKRVLTTLSNSSSSRIFCMDKTRKKVISIFNTNQEMECTAAMLKMIPKDNNNLRDRVNH